MNFKIVFLIFILSTGLLFSCNPIHTPSKNQAAHEPAPLYWEQFKSSVPNATRWSKMIYEIIENKTPEIVTQNSADDVDYFCPNYRSLSDTERLTFWAQLFVGISKFESRWNSSSSTVEYKMKTKDRVTQLPLASEGLLQLSYQDQKNYNLNCGFDWEKDKNLKKNDPHKTILNPYNNLSCGIQIFASQLKRFGKIVVNEPRQLYWSVLYHGKSNKIKEIAQITKTLKFCNK